MNRYSRFLIVLHQVGLVLFLLMVTARTEVYAADPIIRIDIPSTFNPVGSGARALGMGGAFIAVADDATAASWNPAGLIQLERPEMSVVTTGFRRTEDNSFSKNPESNGAETVYKADLNYLSTATPVDLRGYSLTVALTYQRLYDFARHWTFPMSISTEDASQAQRVDVSQDGSLTALGLSCCLLLTPDLSLGVTLNIWDDGLTENNWERSLSETGQGTYTEAVYQADFDLYTYERYTFEGVNANLGLLWTVNKQLTLGAVLKTPFTADLDYRKRIYTKVNYTDPAFPTHFVDESTVTEHCTLTMPLSLGLGAAFRSSDALTLSMDCYATLWNSFKLKDSHGNTTSPISGRPYHESDISPTVQVRAGAEYLVILRRYLVPLRAGVFYDPAPAEGSPDDYFGAAVGAGINTNRFSLDAAYQYRFGQDVGDSILTEHGFSQDVREHTLYASLIWYFK